MAWVEKRPSRPLGTRISRLADEEREAELAQGPNVSGETRCSEPSEAAKFSSAWLERKPSQIEKA